MNIETLKRIAELGWPQGWGTLREDCSNTGRILSVSVNGVPFNPESNAEQRINLEDMYLIHLTSEVENGLETLAIAKTKFMEACKSTEALLEAIARDCLEVA